MAPSVFFSGLYQYLGVRFPLGIDLVLVEGVVVLSKDHTKGNPTFVETKLAKVT